MERVNRWAASALNEIGRPRRWRAIVVTVVGLGLCWLIAFYSDPVKSVSRHWFYVPVVFAAVRFEMRGALAAGIAAGILAGPLAGGLSTLRVEPAVWGLRAMFFIGIGVVVATLVTLLRRNLVGAVDLAQREAALASQQATFIQTISHEFRTPLTVLRGGIETLDRQQDRIDPNLRPLVASLLRAEKRLDDMVSVVLATVEAADASRQLDTEPVRLEALVGDIVASLDALDAPARVRTDLGHWDRIVTVPDYLRLILRALIENALRFTPDDREVIVSAAIEPDRAVIEVRDHGDGMDDDVMAVAFDPFTQGDGSSRRIRGGLGLGLFTARRLAERLDGTVAIASADPGLTVTVTLPQRRAADELARAPGTSGRLRAIGGRASR